MSQNDFTLIVLIVLCLTLLGHAGTRYVDSMSVEAELQTEVNLLEKASAGDCAKESGCGSASLKLTVESKMSEARKGLMAAYYGKRKAIGEGALTLLGFVFILILYNGQLWALFVWRLGLRPDPPPKLVGTVQR